MKRGTVPSPPPYPPWGKRPSEMLEIYLTGGFEYYILYTAESNLNSIYRTQGGFLQYKHLREFHTSDKKQDIENARQRLFN